MEKFSANTQGSSLQEDKFLNTLAEAYRLQEAIISATELSIISTDKKGIITSYNNAAEILLGYSADEMVSKSSLLAFHDLDEVVARAQVLTQELGFTVEPGLDAIVAKAREKNIADRREWTYVRKNGSRFPVMLSVTALLDQNEDLIGYAAIATDITEQKRISEKVAESSSHLRALINSIEDIIYEVDKSGRYLNAWTKSDALPTFPKEEIIGKTLTDLYGERYAQPFDEVLQEVIATGTSRIYTFCAMVNKEARWFNAKYSLIYHHGAPTDRISISIHDVTDRKHAEVALLESEQKFRLLAENIPGIIYLCNNDAHHSMIYLNDRIEEITGYAKEEFLQGTVHLPLLHHTDEKTSIRKKIDDALELKNSFHLTYRIKHRSGEWRWLQEFGIGVYEGDQLLWIEGFINDVTQRKLAEEEILQSKTNLESVMLKLQEQNKQLDEFAHIISHNLRSPMGNIQALLSFLNEKSSPEDYQLIFSKLQNVSQTLNETMNELMDTLKIKKNTAIARTELRFKDTLDRIIQLLEGNLIQCGAAVTFDFKTPTIYYPKTYLESIFQNLLSNAIKYRSNARPLKVHFASEMNGDVIQLRVTDNGQGIDLNKFGDKLFGMHKTFHEHAEARGIGLFLTKTQVETLGGHIYAESKVDEGTTFIIEFGA